MLRLLGCRRCTLSFATKVFSSSPAPSGFFSSPAPSSSAESISTMDSFFRRFRMAVDVSLRYLRANSPADWPLYSTMSGFRSFPAFLSC